MLSSSSSSAPSRSSQHGPAVALGAIVVLIALALLLPAIRQDPAYHHFADERRWLGVPNAANVLSNLAFAAVGLFGVIRLLSSRRLRLQNATVASLWFVCMGFILTACGSAWYHLQPNDATLVWDRLPMTFVLAGVISAAVAQRVGEKVAIAALAMLTVFGIFSVAYWRASGNLTPYAVLQFGGIAVLLVLLLVTRRDHDPFAWAWIAGWYCFAKVAELADEQLWLASGSLVAGHTIKHLAAAAAGAAMFHSLRTR